MSSYFVNSLTTCYNQGVGDGGGGEAPRDYPQTGSPYRGYSVSNPPYPYGSPSPNTGQNGDYYMTQRLSHPPLGRDTTSPPNNVMGTENTSTPTNTAADYSTTSRYTANHSSTSNSSELSPIDSSPQPPQQTTNVNASNNNNNNNNNTSSTVPSPDSSQSPPASNTTSQRQNSTGSEQSSSSPPPGQQNQTSASSPGSQPHIYPWMRRMHVGHGKHSPFATLTRF